MQAKEEAPKEEQAEEEDSGDAAAAPSSNNPYLALAVGDNDDNEGGPAPGADGEASAAERMPKRQSAAELAGAALRILCLGGLGEVLEGDSAAAATAAATGRNGSATLAAAAGSSVLTPGWQHRLQPRGLVNTGNSCFINSILQVRGGGAVQKGRGRV